MRHALSWGAVMVAFTLLCLGCSDSHRGMTGRTMSGGLSCDSAACGGNVEGHWDIVGACAEGEAAGDIQEQCPGATVDIIDLDLDGSLEFNTDGTGTSDISSTVTARINFPGDCLMGLSCEQLEGVIRDGGEADGTCSSRGDGCGCSFTFSGSNTESISWETQGNNLIIDGDASQAAGYCVEGDSLIIRNANDNFSLALVLERG